jgi:hypothetical protein
VFRLERRKLGLEFRPVFLPIGCCIFLLVLKEVLGISGHVIKVIGIVLWSIMMFYGVAWFWLGSSAMRRGEIGWRSGISIRNSGMSLLLGTFTAIGIWWWVFFR